MVWGDFFMSTESKAGFLPSVIRGALIALITALVGVLVFSFIIKIAVLNASVIKTVNQFIKVLSIFLGCMIASGDTLGFIKGIFIGGLSSALIYLVFSLIFGQVQFGIGFVLDIIFSAVIGAISGVISVNLKKK